MKASSQKPDKQIVYHACPLGSIGGGMYRVVNYLTQASLADASSYRFIELDTRGSGSSWLSIFYAIKAAIRVSLSAAKGELAGLHVHMAERLSVYRKGILILAASIWGIPVILHLHAAQFPVFYNSQNSFFKAVVRWIFSRAHQVIALGANAQNFIIKELRIPANKVSIVVNGVPNPIFPRRQRTPSDRFELLFLGNLSERKGVSDLLKAVSGLPEGTDWHIVFAGGGDIEAYRRISASLGLQARVDFPGWQSQEQASKLLSNADILILPSYDEGLPLVVLEALANGVAVICTPVGEIPNFLTKEEVMLVPAGDIDMLRSAISEIIDDEKIRGALERNGKIAFERKFSVSHAYSSIALLYEQHFRRGGA